MLTPEEEEDRALKVLQNLDTIATSNPDLLVSISEKLINVIVEIFCTQTIPQKIRNSALTLCTSYSIGLAKKLKKSAFFETCVPRMFELLILEAPDMNSLSTSSHNAHSGEMKTNLAEAIESNDIRDRLVESIALICEALTVKITWPKIMPLVIQALRTSEPPANSNIQDFPRKSHWAGMQVLSTVCVGAARHFKNQLGELMTLVMPFLQTDSPRVLHATLGALGVLSEEFFPLVQRLHGPAVLTKLGAVMSAENLPVQLRQRAVACLTNFTSQMLTKAMEDTEDEAAKMEATVPGSLAELAPVLTMSQIRNLFKGNFESVANGLVSLFKLAGASNNYDLLSNVLVAVSILSNILRDEFVKCYSFFSEGLRALLSNFPVDANVVSEKMTTMQVQLVETFSFLISSSAQDPNQKEAVFKDYQSLMSFLEQIIFGLDARDDRRRGASTFFSMMALHFKEEFMKHRAVIFKHLFECMALQVSLKVEDSISGEGNATGNGVASFNIDLKVHGGKKVLSLDYGALHNKQTAFEVFVDVLKEFPQSLAEEHKATALELVKASFPKNSSSDVKKLCFKTLKLLIRSVPQTEARVAIFESCLPLAIAEIQRAIRIPHRDNVYRFSRKLISILREVNRPSQLLASWSRSRAPMFSTAGQGLCSAVDALLGNLDTSKPRPPQNYQDLVCVMGAMMDFQSQIKTRVKAEYQNETMDPEVLEEFEEAFAEGNEIFQVVMELFGELCRFDLPVEVQTKLTQVFSKSFFGLNPQLQNQVESLAAVAIPGYLNPDEMIYLSCWVCDLAENLDLGLLVSLLPQLDTFSRIMIISCPQVPDVLQNVAYFNNLLASRIAVSAPPSFKNSLIERLQFLTQLFQTISIMAHTDPEGFGPASDNCVSTLVRFVLLFRDNLFDSQTAFASGIRPYLPMLPLRDDPIEGVVIHSLIAGVYKQVVSGQLVFDANVKNELEQAVVRILQAEAEEAQDDDLILEKKRVNDDFVCAIQRKQLIHFLSN